MWHSFMNNNKIVITGVTLSQYLILHSILRQKQEIPKLSLFFDPPTPLSKLDPKIQPMVVNMPN